MNFRLRLPRALVTLCVACMLVSPLQAQNLTLGKIQQSVKVGVSKEKVLEELGSPNMVTGSSADMETWVYDKVSTTTQVDGKSESGSVIGGAFLGFIGIGGKSSSSATGSTTTTSQRNLTLVIKFKGDVVDSYATRMSSF